MAFTDYSQITYLLENETFELVIANLVNWYILENILTSIYIELSLSNYTFRKYFDKYIELRVKLKL